MNTASTQQTFETPAGTSPVTSSDASPDNGNLITLLENVETHLLRQQSINNRYLLRRVRKELATQRNLRESAEAHLN